MKIAIIVSLFIDSEECSFLNDQKGTKESPKGVLPMRAAPSLALIVSPPPGPPLRRNALLSDR